MSKKFNDSPLYRVEKLDDDLYCIVEANLVNMYVVLGQEKAMLIDTGYGYGDFRPLIREITDLPLVVFNTHGHPDHALGSYLFDEVYLAEEDYEELVEHIDPVFKKESIDFRYSVFPDVKGLIDEKAYCEADYSHTKIHFAKEGDTFDLGGGLILEAYSLPGHTDGSLCLLDRKNGRFYTGDIITRNNIWCFMSPERNSFKKMLYSFKKAKALSGEFSEIYSAHREKPLTNEVIDELIECIYDLRDNRENDPRFYSALADTVNKLPKYSHQYKDVLIIYSDETLVTLPGKDE